MRSPGRRAAPSPCRAAGVPNWISITTDTLYEAKIAPLIDACSTSAKADGQDDRVAGLVQGVVDEIRNAVATCRGNRVDDDETTIPKSLRRVAVAQIIAALKNAVEIPLTEDEVKEIERADRKLRDVARCLLTVEQPDTPVAAPIESGSEIETIAEGNQGNSREDLAGL